MGAITQRARSRGQSSSIFFFIQSMETNATCCGVLLPRCTFYMKFMQCRRTRCSLYVWDVQIYWPTFTILPLHPHLTLIICWRMSHEYVILRYCTEDICTIRLPKSLKRWALAAFCLFFFSCLCFSSFFLAYIHTLPHAGSHTWLFATLYMVRCLMFGRWWNSAVGISYIKEHL